MNNLENFFILGNPRSGTSLLRIILNCHSHVVIPPECGFLLWWHKKYRDKNIDSLILNSFFDDILSSKKIETWNLDKQKLYNLIKNNMPLNYPLAANMVYLAYAHLFDKKPSLIGDKNNYYTKHIKEIIEIYPNAKLIHIVRDPRDVACSYMNIKKLTTTSEYKPILPNIAIEIAKDWNKNNNDILYSSNLVENKHFISIRYEDLLTNTKEILIKICSFLNINFEEQLLLYHINNKNNYIEPLKTIEWKKKTLEPIDISNIGKYKQELSIDDIQTIEDETKEIREIFNYE